MEQQLVYEGIPPYLRIIQNTPEMVSAYVEGALIPLLYNIQVQIFGLPLGQQKLRIYAQSTIEAQHASVSVFGPKRDELSVYHEFSVTGPAAQTECITFAFVLEQSVLGKIFWCRIKFLHWRRI